MLKMRIKKVCLLLVFQLMCSFSLVCPKSVIINDKGGSRLGDKLIKYITSKWLAYKYNLSFLFKSFRHSEEFLMYFQEKHYSTLADKTFEKEIKLRKEDQIENDTNESIIYKCHFKCVLNTDLFTEIIHNPTFRNNIRMLIQPINEIKLNIPQDKISVAVHIRKGGGFDPPLFSQQIFKKFADKKGPLRFPPEQYYIDQLNKLSTLLPGKQLYVFIFTDHPKPKEIVERFKKQISNTNITFDYREHGNAHNKNVVEDLFLMVQFDCLIKSSSNYSKISQFIGNFKIIIRPFSYHWEENKLIMDDIKAILPDYKKNVVDYFPFDSSNQELKTALNNVFSNS